jgi:hypothetical protein
MTVVYLDGGGNRNRILTERNFEGTAVVYAAKGHESVCIQCDYQLKTRLNTKRLDVRAVRKAKIAEGERPPLLPDERIRDQIVVIVGSEISHRGVPLALRALAEKIEREGLSIGLDESGKSVTEQASSKTAW